MATPLIAKELQTSFRQVLQDAKAMRHEQLTLEHLLLALSQEAKTEEVLTACGASVKQLRQRLETFLKDSVEKLPEGVSAEPQQTIGIERVLQRAAIHALSADQKVIEGGDVLVAMFREEESTPCTRYSKRASPGWTSSSTLPTASRRLESGIVRAASVTRARG
jgi:ATP-dependent Clp protease ATP-binding subunit ClpA